MKEKFIPPKEQILQYLKENVFDKYGFKFIISRNSFEKNIEGNMRVGFYFRFYTYGSVGGAVYLERKDGKKYENIIGFANFLLREWERGKEGYNCSNDISDKELSINLEKNTLKYSNPFTPTLHPQEEILKASKMIASALIDANYLLQITSYNPKDFVEKVLEITKSEKDVKGNGDKYHYNSLQENLSKIKDN